MSTETADAGTAAKGAAKSIRQRVREAASPPEDKAQRIGGCEAYGCPCRGSVDLGSGGKFFCQWHAWADPSAWADVTASLEQHRWLIDHIEELQRLYAKPSKGAPWIRVAETYWREQPEMMPTPVERTNWNFYLWRLREELAHRCGLRKERPVARKPERESWGPVQRVEVDEHA
jgi:hypothetical protein